MRKNIYLQQFFYFLWVAGPLFALKCVSYWLKEKKAHIGAAWDEIAPTKKDAIRFAHTFINAEPDRNHGNYSEYLLAIFGMDHNKYYREGEKNNSGEKKISDMVASHSCTRDIVLYRGVHNCVLKGMFATARKEKEVDLYELGYMQCSLVKGCESKSPMKLRIYIPAGSHVVYLGNVNDEQFYYEVDIQHGGRLKIMSIDEDYINCILLKTD